MTPDHAAALSLIPDLPRRGLTGRLLGADPELLERADALSGRARDARRRAAESGVEFLPWNDERFPAVLLAIPDCPPGLWFRGAPDALAGPAVAIVGSRAGSSVALEMAARLATDLAAYGLIVVSGLARGVDSAAHRGALASGRTVAVLGSGLDQVYPPEHRELADRIAAAGAVVTEFPPGTPPLAFHFPMRNRIISGLSRVVVVIEAAEGSGSLITASCALEQGRDVMAVPGNVLSGRNRGGHALIRDGAKIVECADDIVEELRLGGVLPPAPCRARDQQAISSGTTTSGDSLLEGMAPGQAYELDALAAETGLGAAVLLPRLSTLELSGRIRRVDGGRFMRTS
jgi:DNA processing protein